jgi:NADPH2:quinone reductase
MLTCIFALLRFDQEQVGDRVAYNHLGTYCEYTAVPEDRLVPVPSVVALDVAAACMVQGMTAHYLTRAAFPITAGHTVLVHAAAGGTGWRKHSPFFVKI